MHHIGELREGTAEIGSETPKMYPNKMRNILKTKLHEKPQGCIKTKQVPYNNSNLKFTHFSNLSWHFYSV